MDHCRTARAVPAHRVRGRGSGLPATRQRGRRVMRASGGATARSLGIAAALCLALLAGGVSPAVADALPPGPISPAPAPDPIDAYAPYNPQSTCDPTVKPGTQYVLDMVIAYYGVGRRSSTSRACSVAGTSEQGEAERGSDAQRSGSGSSGCTHDSPTTSRCRRQTAAATADAVGRHRPRRPTVVHRQKQSWAEARGLAMTRPTGVDPPARWIPDVESMRPDVG